jgi:hypothetical protein
MTPALVARALPQAALALVLLGASACEQKRTTLLSDPISAEPNASVEVFGDPLTTPSPSDSLALILEAPLDFAGTQVTVQGKVRRACSRRGCWMELSEGLDANAPGCRVTFKNYGFFVPLDSQGATATVEGQVTVKRVPKSRVEHLEAEGAVFPSKNPDGSASEVQLVATGVEMVR